MDLPNFRLGEPLNLRELQTTGSVLHINENFDEEESPDFEECASSLPSTKVDFIGKPVESFGELENHMVFLDKEGYVKKKIIEEGSGTPLDASFTVSIAYSGYWENEQEPFDVKSLKKPMEVDLKDNGLLPGLSMAINSMVVGELSVFLLSHQVMYGEMGVPPRIKPKATCVFFIKLIRSEITPELGKINFTEAGIFPRVHKEVKLLYSSGYVLFKANNFSQAIQLFNKAVYMLHKCRLADINEEKQQEYLLKKLYLNLAVCYNKIQKPFKTCIACNELNRLNSLFNNGKALFIQAKAYRMIGEFDRAEKRLIRAKRLCPDNNEIDTELNLLEKARNTCNQNKLISEKIASLGKDVVSDSFKQEIDMLVKNFKQNSSVLNLKLSVDMTSAEMKYVKEACIRENLFFNKVPKIEDICEDTNQTNNIDKALPVEYAMMKDDEQSTHADTASHENK